MVDFGVRKRTAAELKAGRMRHRIRIEQSSETQDAAGQPVRTWATFLPDYPVAIDEVKGGEVLRGRQVSAEASIVFVGRWYAGVDSTMRVIFDGQTLGIVRASDPYGDRRELRIECREVV